jgi:transcriptional regulator with XRE-family HTH domain
MDVPSLLETLGSTPSASARATGLARSTIQRVSSGTTSPTLETLRELALAAGYDIDLRLVPASDAAAAVAARVMVDPATPALDDLEGRGVTGDGNIEAISQWVSRLERQSNNDPKRVLELAGRFSAPQHRKGARFFAPKSGLTQERLIDIANSALDGHFGALSGVAAARVYAGHAPDPGPVVVWTGDLDAVADRLAASLREVGEYQHAGVLLSPTTSGYFVDMLMPPAWEHNVVSPIQAAIDLFGLGYDMLANEITDGW